LDAGKISILVGIPESEVGESRERNSEKRIERGANGDEMRSREKKINPKSLVP